MATAAVKCGNCGKGRVKAGSNLCATCTRKAFALMPATEESVIVVSEPLMYAQYHRNGASKDSIVKVMAAFYPSDVLGEAKCLLWSKFDDTDLLEPMLLRQTSCNRTDKEAICDDILRAIGNLLESGVRLQCVAQDWKMVPKCHPEGVTELSLGEKLATLEGKLNVFEDAISEIKCETIQQGQKIMSLVNDSKQHDQLINQVMQKTHTRDMNGYPLLADVVARATPPVQGAAIKQLARPHGQTDGVATRYAPMNRRITENKVRTEAVEHTHTQVGVVPDSSEGFVIPQAHRRKNEKVAQRRNNQRRGVIIGRGESTGLTAVPPPQRDFFISRVHKLDGMKEVGDFMTNKGVHIRDISKRSNDNAKMNSFKISISVDDMQKVKDPLFWPKGWIVRRWFERVESIQNDGRVAQSERVHRNSI